MGTPDNPPGTADPAGARGPIPLRPGGSRLLAPAGVVGAVRVVAISDRRLMVPAEVLAAAGISTAAAEPTSDCGGGAGGGGSGAAGDAWAAVANAFAAAIARAVAGCPPGSVIVQVREKDLDGGPLLTLVRAALPLAPVVVNDRLDVALAAGAAGVHLPERGVAIADARAIAAAAAAAAATTADLAIAADASALLIGVSRHAVPGDTGADLVQLGSIWPTPSKPSVAPLGEAALAWPHGSAVLVAVGGIDSPERAERAAAAGADAVAVIRAAWTGDSLAPYVAAVDAGRARR